MFSEQNLGGTYIVVECLAILQNERAAQETFSHTPLSALVFFFSETEFRLFQHHP